MSGHASAVLVSRLVLVTGGARSGKSRWAESRLAELAPPPWRYLATAEALDDEMRARIAAHRAARDHRWSTVEVPRALGDALDADGGPALVDCVTLWVSNLLLSGATDAAVLGAVDDLAARARAHPAPVVLVTNEVGSGIVPEHALARRFRDVAGWANQRLAAAAAEVVLLSCGLPLRLK